MFNYTKSCIKCNVILYNVTKLHIFGVEMYAENLKKLRKKMGLSVAKLADLLEMPARTITVYEREESAPSWKLFVQLNNKANINLNWFVSGEGQMFNAPKFEDVEDVMEAKVMAILKKQGVIKWKKLLQVYY